MLSVDDSIARFLRTGDHDMMYAAWPGATLVERARRGHDDLRAALAAEVRARSVGIGWRGRVVIPDDMAAYTRSKIEPMVRGLFARREHDAILELLTRSVVLVTDDTVERVLGDIGWLSTAWNVANLYLRSLGAEPLGESEDAVGLSSDLKAYVTPEYFVRQAPFVDFLVHECAHVLHDAKLERIGLSPTRSRERLVELEYRERETFAFSIEAYATIAAAASTTKRRKLVEQFIARKPFPSHAVDVAKVESVIAEAAATRNGWKHVLDRCAPATPPRYRLERRLRPVSAASLTAPPGRSPG